MDEDFAGIVPDFSQFFSPIADYETVLAQIGNDSAREYWREKLIDAQRLRIIALPQRPWALT